MRRKDVLRSLCYVESESPDSSLQFFKHLRPFWSRSRKGRVSHRSSDASASRQRLIPFFKELKERYNALKKPEEVSHAVRTATEVVFSKT